MPTVADDLDIVQKYLRDTTSTVWSRAELLRLYQDGYRQLLAKAQGVRRFTILPMPPRYAFAGSHPWERRHAQGGTFRHWTYSGPGAIYQCTALWEIENNGAIAAPADAHTCVTQLWEMAYVQSEVNTDYRFALPRDHDRIKALWHDHKPVTPLNTKALDALESAWNRAQGDPWTWVPGYGESQSFEVYHIQTDYSDDYTYLSDAYYGLPRTISGARDYTASGVPLQNGFAYTTQADALHFYADPTPALYGFGLRLTTDPTPNPGGQYQSTYIWEQERHQGATSLTDAETMGTYGWEAAYGATNVSDYPVGLIREISSPDRQYLPIAEWDVPYGVIRDWHSSEGNLLVHEVVIADVPTLTEPDTPILIPTPLQKYLRYYTLYAAYNRQGEGYRPDLAGHWLQRWQRGVALLRKLGDIDFADVAYQREAKRPEREGRLTRYAPLPPTYGQVRA